MGQHYKKLINDSEMKSLEELIKEASAASELKRLQCVYFRGKGLLLEEISELVQYSVGHIKRIWTLYFRGGIESLQIKPRGGRRRFHLEFEEEKMLLEKHAKEAGDGKILEIDPLYEEFCKRCGKKVALSTAYRLAKRHGWRKLTPKPHHQKRDAQSAAYFKIFFP